jgi:hypothetical protein
MTMMERIEKMRVSDDALDLVFRKARTYNAWLPKPVPEELLRQLYDTLKWGQHERKHQSCEILIHSFHGCKGASPSSARAWERTEDDGRSGHSHHRL